MNLPTEDDLQRLPPRAIAGYAARCVRRIQPLLAPIWEHRTFRKVKIAFEDALIPAERFSVGLEKPFSHPGDALPLMGPGNIGKILMSPMFAYSAAVLAKKGEITEAARMAAQAAHIAYASLAGDGEFLNTVEPYISFYGTEEEAIAAFDHPEPQTDLRLIKNSSVTHLLRRDFDLLLETAKRDRWNVTSSIPDNLFSLHSEFDHVVDWAQISPIVNERVVEYFRRYPHRLYEMQPRKFEELIGELFVGFGFDVELTSPTADGGRDVIAISNSSLRLKCLIECKRYAKNNSVGLAIVQRLHGVVEGEDANKGILVTTSSFTKPARDFMRKKTWLLEGRDFHGSSSG